MSRGQLLQSQLLRRLQLQLHPWTRRTPPNGCLFRPGCCRFKTRWRVPACRTALCQPYGWQYGPQEWYCSCQGRRCSGKGQHCCTHQKRHCSCGQHCAHDEWHGCIGHFWQQGARHCAQQGCASCRQRWQQQWRQRRQQQRRQWCRAAQQRFSTFGRDRGWWHGGREARHGETAMTGMQGSGQVGIAHSQGTRVGPGATQVMMQQGNAVGLIDAVCWLGVKCQLPMLSLSQPTITNPAQAFSGATIRLIAPSVRFVFPWLNGSPPPRTSLSASHHCVCVHVCVLPAAEILDCQRVLIATKQLPMQVTAIQKADDSTLTRFPMHFTLAAAWVTLLQLIAFQQKT